MNELTNNIKRFVQNPLGVIALFVTALYGIASMLFSSAFDNLQSDKERLPVIWFVILFPIIMFGTFVWLVVKHNHKLYSPGDFKDEKWFAVVNGKTFTPGKEPTAIKKEEIIELSAPVYKNHSNKRNTSYNNIEEFALKKLSEEEDFVVKSQAFINNGSNRCEFDGYAEKEGKTCFIEIKRLFSIEYIHHVVKILNKQSRVIYEMGNSNTVFYIVFITDDIFDKTKKSTIRDLLVEYLNCNVVCKFYTLKEIGIDENK